MTTVFIAGGFDLFHSAHLSILRRARALGDRLIVGLNDDAYFKTKGPGRPIDDVAVRTEKVMSSGVVDEVIVFSGTPLQTIMDLKPDVITCGDDYTVETTVGYPECLAWNGRVVILPRTPGISTTDLINGRPISSAPSLDEDRRAFADKINQRVADSRDTLDYD